MKKLKKIVPVLGMTLVAGSLVMVGCGESSNQDTATPTSTNETNAEANKDMIYGTMNIPYTEFFAGEGVEGEVDAVSSATDTKWNSEDFVKGTFNEAKDNGAGTILGVTYPVAITQADLDALGDNNYSFQVLTETPAAYKTVTVTDGKASFSNVNGTEAKLENVTAEISTETAWGDYLIDLVSSDENEEPLGESTLYGAVVVTDDDKVYPMRHLQNLWFGELAWSTGFTTEEPHGNTLDYDMYEDIMGKSITSIKYITEEGYKTVDTSLYVPIKYNAELNVANGNDGTGIVAVTLKGFPEEYDMEFTVEGLEGATANATEITYTDALANKYVLRVSDKKGVYADFTTEFTLATDVMPATFADNKISILDGADEVEFNNFINNIATVEVNGQEYPASGRKSVQIIKEDGTIDLEATAGRGDDKTLVFAESGEYTLKVASTGYNNVLEFKVVK